MLSHQIAPKSFTLLWSLAGILYSFITGMVLIKLNDVTSQPER